MPVKARVQILSEKILSRAAVRVFHFEDDRNLQGSAIQVDSYADGALSILLRHGVLPAVKAVMDMLGFDAGPPRLPLLSLPQAQREQLRRELEAIDFFDFALEPV